MKIIFFVVFLLVLSTILVTLYFNIGFFIVQPCRQDLDGSIIMYWRTDFKLEIKESVAGIITKSNLPNTNLMKDSIYTSLVPAIKKKQIKRFNYYKFLDK